MSIPYRKRTVHMSTARSEQLALAAASIGVNSEILIQTFITMGLLTMAEHDSPLAFALARSGGASFDDLEALAKATAERQGKLA
jgi:hypothetical protein